MPIWNRKDIRIPEWKAKWWIFRRKLCTQRILIVTDTTGSFDPGSNTGLTELIDVLEGNGDVPAAVPAVITKVSKANGFAFASASPAVTTKNYDQIWLFGFGSGPASTNADEIRVIAKFMQTGGGVFATGDHSDIGRPLCGALPRIRKMREWSAVPMSGPTRIDTVNHPGVDGIARNSDQSDQFPQSIYPVPDASSAPHSLLRSSAGTINNLPDHPHESECYAPRGSALAGNFSVSDMADFPEFPPVAGSPFGPELVAISMSASLNQDKGAVTPRCFGAISAYNGHLANVGRVVCDSTWHHFVNMNLNSSNPYDDIGLHEGSPPVANAAYKQIQRYYANIADYLTPKNRKWCRLFDVVATEIFDYPILEEIITLPPIPPRFPDIPDWPRAVEIGKLVRSSLENKYGKGAFSSLIDDIFDVADMDENTMLQFNAGLHGFSQQNLKKKTKQFDDPEALMEIKLGMVGNIVTTMKQQLPNNPDEFVNEAEKLISSGKEIISAVTTSSLHEGITHRLLSYQENLKHLSLFEKEMVSNRSSAA